MKIERLLILDWFDGPTEAIALTSERGSLLLRLRAELPIRRDSVYELQRLRDDAYSQALSACVNAFGPATEPSWIVPCQENTATMAAQHVEVAIAQATVPTDDRTAWCTSADLAGERLVLHWRNAAE
jgi:hypothetical protein